LRQFANPQKRKGRKAKVTEKTIEWRTESTVELISSNVSDSMVVKAARVSTKGEESRGEQSDQGLIRYLLKNRHWSPFAHGSMTFLVHTPIFVSREFLRHQSWTFNETSGRYRELEPVFYVPSRRRPLKQEGKPGHYTFVEGTDDQYRATLFGIQEASVLAYDEYKNLLNLGVAREVARMVLPVNIFTSFYATATPRSILHFLDLRDDEAAQQEIREVAQQIGIYLEREMPATLAAYREVKQ
jgi:thymidylate synthase (FAD)